MKWCSSVMGAVACALVSMLAASQGFVLNASPAMTSFVVPVGHMTSSSTMQRKAPRNGAASLVAEVRPPQDLYSNAVTLGEKKGMLSVPKTFTLAILSGFHISIGALLALSVGGCCPGLAASNPGLRNIIMGAIGLPFGLYMTLVGGGELFTGNTALVTAARLEGKITTKQLLKNWVVSYIGNFLGCLIMVALTVGASGVANPLPAVGIATSKSTLTFKTAFLRGVLANWLVCMAVWMAAGARDAIGKFISILLPISAFVAIGLDHSVANMFMIPLGIKLGAAVTVRQFLLNNLIPVTLGNIVGGAVLCCGMYSCAYGSTLDKA